MAFIECTGGSGADFSEIIYENLAAANIKKGITINVKDPDGNVLKSELGTAATLPDKTIFLAGQNIDFTNPSVSCGSLWGGGGKVPITYAGNGQSSSHYYAYLSSPINMTGKKHIYISGYFRNNWICRAHIQGNTSFGENTGYYVNLSGTLVTMDVTSYSGNYYLGFTASSYSSGNSCISIDHIYYD